MIENERKYILNDERHGAYFRKLKSLPDARTIVIAQGYLNDNTRIRSSEENGITTYEFTFKIMTHGGLVEIEKPIDKEEFDLLWTKVGHVINKTRIKIPHGELIWEVDFFTVQTMPQPFLVMAEVELAPGVEEPPEVPSWIQERFLHLVARGDNRFVNGRMVHPMEVRRHVTKMKNGKL